VSVIGAGFIKSGIDEHAERTSAPPKIAITRYIIRKANSHPPNHECNLG
jgi:hypothetical protein